MEGNTHMSEDITADAGDTTTESVATDEKPFTAPQSQDDLNKIIETRLARERAKFADYDELRKAAEKLSAIEAANKSEAEKTAERLAAAEKRASELEAQALRAEVANEKGVPAKLLSGASREELEAAADELIAFRGEQKPPAPKSSALGRVNQADANPAPTSPGIGTLRAAYGN